MEDHRSSCSSETQSNEEEMDFRRGPWTVEEDLILMNYIANHGEGRWNSLARCAGLKRTGKSCRLRWLNYLRPDVRRGNITPEEQLLILELHSRWGNRWSKIAQHLPGRTDNEIKNYWRTRVQKHAKQLQCDVNSKQFKDLMRYLWMPRLLERIRAANSASTAAVAPAYTMTMPSAPGSSSESSLGTEFSPPLPVYDCLATKGGGGIQADQLATAWFPAESPSGYSHQGSLEFEQNMWGEGEDESLWSVDDTWSLQHMISELGELIHETKDETVRKKR